MAGDDVVAGAPVGRCAVWQIDWSVPPTALDDLFGRTLGLAQAMRDWYANNRMLPRNLGQIARIVSVVGIGLAAVFQVLLSLNAGSPTYAKAYAVCSALALGVGAMAISLDRALMWSNTWIRFIAAFNDLTGAIDAFQLDAQRLRRAWSGGEPSEDQQLEALGLCRDLVTRVGAIVQAETARWSEEYRAATEALASKLDDAMAKAKQRADQADSAAPASGQ